MLTLIKNIDITASVCLLKLNSVTLICNKKKPNFVNLKLVKVPLIFLSIIINGNKVMKCQFINTIVLI